MICFSGCFIEIMASFLTSENSEFVCGIVRCVCKGGGLIMQVLIQSSRLYEGQETLVLTEMNADSLNLGSAFEQGIFTGYSLFSSFF